MAEGRSAHLKRTLLEVVDNQLRDGVPPETRATLDRLMAAGVTRDQALLRIAGVLELEVLQILESGQSYNHARYTSALNALRS